MANYRLTKKAVEDLSKIWDYTYEAWSENQAEKYFFELLEDCQLLAENQNLGKKYLANEAKRENVSVTIKKSRKQFVVIPKLGIFE